MGRLNATTKTELAKDSFNLATLIKFGFSTPTYITDYGQDITYDSNTYSASSHLLQVGEGSKTGGIKVNSIDITLSAVQQSYVTTFLTTDYMNKQVIIYRAAIDSDGDVIGEPYYVL